MTEKDISDSKNTTLNDTTCDVTVRIDPADLERTMKISDEELQKALQHRSDRDTDNDSEESSSITSFFNMNSTSTFSSIFEKKRNVEDDIQQHTSEINISSENINQNNDAEVVLQNIEGSFETINTIGEGGQGTVFSVADRSLGRIIALKSLHKKLSDNKKSRAHFIAEAKITAQLDYPGIVPVYSLNTDSENGLHLAMKFINGETLAEYLSHIREQYSKTNVNKFNENRSIRKRLEIFLRSCDAIAYAHSRNVMHCDLKPENIMLGHYNDSYIMDWGIARLIENPSIKSGNIEKPKSISGTPRYLSPETVNGEFIDERVDIYSLGLILFECVFLKTAFNGKDTKEVVSKIRNHEMEKFTHEFKYPVDKDLVAIIRKATAFDRDERYQSVNDLADDIRHYLANEETKARPDNIISKMLRFSEHHIKVILILVLACLLLTGGAFSYSFYQKNKHNRFILARDIALSAAYSRALYVAGLIELQMNNVANSLKSLSAYISFMLMYNADDNILQSRYFFVPEEMQKERIGNDIFFSEACNMPVSIDRMSFNHPTGKYTPEMKNMMEKLQMMQPVLKKNLLYDNVFRKKDENIQLTEKEAEKYYFSYGSPILWFYGGFENGLYFNMPGQTKFQRQFDPRQRLWYKAAAQRTPFDDVVWSLPYIDTYSGRMTLTASLPIFVNGKIQGVIAVDNMLLYIARFMKNNGNTDGFLLAKVIVDSEGKTLLSTRENYSVETKNTSFSRSNIVDYDFFENHNVLKYVKKNKSGIMNIKTDNGRNIVYLFYRINSLNWYYIEKIDIDMLLDDIKTDKKQ
ncbi:MAG: protein kinase [Lentisphaeria bacterium]|nr:protein kinase [Lentisphaeria bacterium]